MDVKAHNDRQTQSLADELPSRLERDIRTFEQKEVMLHKEYQVNMASMQDGLSTLKEQQLRLSQQVKEQFQKLDVITNETKVRAESLARHMQSLE